MKEALDIASMGTILGSFMNILPPVAALFAIIWYSIKIYDRFWGINKPIKKETK